MSVPWYLMAKGKGGGYKTASGPIVSISDALAAPLRALTLAIDPVQDLHGYDAPWPAGGGKNKFDPQYFTGDVDTIYLNFHGARNVATAHGTHVKANTTYTCTIQLPTTPSASWGIYGFYANDSATTITFSANGIANPRTFSFTPTEDTDVIMWAYMSGSGNTWSNQGVTSTDNVRVQIEQGSTPTSYAPYSNLCPISGWTEANLWRTGKNLLDPTGSTATTSMYFVGASNANEFPYYLKAGTYTLSEKWAEGKSGYAYWRLLGTSDNNIIHIGGLSSGTFTLSQDGYYRFWYYGNNMTIDSVSDIQLELGSTPTPYEPYTGTTATIQLGQTVYGGTLDVTNGVLTVDKANIASYNGETLPGKWISDRDVYAPGTTPTIGAQVVYELATPITIPLSDITISTLAGQNVLWADCGDVTVEYLSAGGANPDLMKLAVAFMGRK